MTKNDRFPRELSEIRLSVQALLREKDPGSADNWTHVSGGSETGTAWRRNMQAYEGLGFHQKAINNVNIEELDTLFSQIVLLCKQLGMVKLGHVAIDGTKIKANASDANTYDRERIEKEIKRWLEQAEAVDQQEDALYGPDKTGDELPEDIRDPEKRIKKLKELKKKLDAGSKEKINKTDPDTVFMKTRNGIKTAYNAQVSVDAEHQVIVAADVTNQASDAEQLFDGTAD